MSNVETSYIPGVCNINHAEIARRRKAGHLGLAIFIILLIALVILNLNRYYRIILILPAFLAATGYLQAHNRFCIGYASAGQQNATNGSKKASTITNKEAIVSDKRKARHMNMQAFVIAVAAIIVILFIPHV